MTVLVLAASTCNASERQTADGGTTVVLPTPAQFVFNEGAHKYRFLQAADDDWGTGAPDMSPAGRAKRLRNAGTVLFLLTGFPFLPAGVALVSTGDSVDALRVGGAFVALSTSLLVYGVLMFIHADALEKVCCCDAQTTALLQERLHQW